MYKISHGAVLQHVNDKAIISHKAGGVFLGGICRTQLLQNGFCIYQQSVGVAQLGHTGVMCASENVNHGVSRTGNYTNWPSIIRKYFINPELAPPQ